MKSRTKKIVIGSFAAAAILYCLAGILSDRVAEEMYRSEMRGMARSVHFSFRKRTKIVNQEYQIDSMEYEAKAFQKEVWSDSIVKLFRVVKYAPKVVPTYSEAIFRGLNSESIPDYGEALIFQTLNSVSESESLYYYGDSKSFVKWEIGKKGIFHTKITGDSLQVTFWKKR